jgi:hypothetical protein
MPIPQTTKIDPIFRKTLIRNYYYAEGMAVYEAYYLPLVETHEPARKELVDSGRHEDRPPTWVPFVFHCTTEDHIKEIFRQGALLPGKNGAVSFTEIPIGELDRMKYRHHSAAQIAIAFPRRYIQSLGLASVLYLKHNPAVRDALKANKSEYEKVAPFVDETGDVASFQEVRTTTPVQMEQAVWLLTTIIDGEDRPMVPDIDKFKAKYGRISQSFWHRSHQMGILGEWQFTKLAKDRRDVPVRFEFMGEHYWRKETTVKKELSVTLPVQKKKITFKMTDSAKHGAYTGPWRFIDVARSIARVLADTGEGLDRLLPYRLIQNILDL